jgi:hypothetical protein
MVRRAEAAAERAVFLAAKLEQFSSQDLRGILSGQVDAGLTDLAELKVDVGQQRGVTDIWNRLQLGLKLGKHGARTAG